MLVTAIAVVVLVGAVLAFAALWLRSTRAHRALAKRFAARFIALEVRQAEERERVNAQLAQLARNVEALAAAAPDQPRRSLDPLTASAAHAAGSFLATFCAPQLASLASKALASSEPEPAEPDDDPEEEARTRVYARPTLVSRQGGA